MKNKSFVKLLFLIILTSFLIFLTGCNINSDKKDQGDQVGLHPNKEEIQSELTKREVFQVTWSPDDKAVVYIQAGREDNKGMDEAYIWRVGEEAPALVREVSPTTHGFSWSPNSKYFLISEKLGEGATNSIIDAGKLQEGIFKPKSIGMPVWSPNSDAIAYGNEFHGYGESWGYMEVYELGAEISEYIWKAKGYLYKVESWDQDGNIGYTEIDPKGKEIKKTTKNIRPDISGVHLGDSREQVQSVLGKNYNETFLSEPGHFAEQVYRWEYNGYDLFIGAESGKVLELHVTSPEAKTNLGIKIGDSAAKVFEIYRPKYIEPESIHGGKLYGLFKVEGAAALFFNFDLKEGQSLEDIKPENKVVRMILTYPEHLDDSF